MSVSPKGRAQPGLHAKSLCLLQLKRLKGGIDNKQLECADDFKMWVLGRCMCSSVPLKSSLDYLMLNFLKYLALLLLFFFFNFPNRLTLAAVQRRSDNGAHRFSSSEVEQKDSSRLITLNSGLSPTEWNQIWVKMKCSFMGQKTALLPPGSTRAFHAAGNEEAVTFWRWLGFNFVLKWTLKWLLSWFSFCENYEWHIFLLTNVLKKILFHI